MIRVMSDRSLRDVQRSQTHDRIRWALLELLDTESPATISMPMVAKRAGVSLRTVYRYFPTKAELVRSAANWHAERAQQISRTDPIRRQGTEPYLAALWTDFAQNIAGVRAQHGSPGGREVRQLRLDEWRHNLGNALAERLAHLDPAERSDLVDVVIAMSSSSMFLELGDRMGHPPDHAARLAATAIEVLLQDAESKKKESS